MSINSNTVNAIIPIVFSVMKGSMSINPKIKYKILFHNIMFLFKYPTVAIFIDIIENTTNIIRKIMSSGSFRNGIISIAAPNGAAANEKPKRYFGNAILAAVIPTSIGFLLINAAAAYAANATGGVTSAKTA